MPITCRDIYKEWRLLLPDSIAINFGHSNLGLLGRLPSPSLKAAQDLASTHPIPANSACLRRVSNQESAYLGGRFGVVEFLKQHSYRCKL